MKDEQTISTESKFNWKKWLNYQSVVRQIPFFLFLALLAVIYIYNGHYADKMNGRINRMTNEVKELQYEYTNLKGEIIFRSKPGELLKAVDAMELKPVSTPPVVLGAVQTN